MDLYSCPRLTAPDLKVLDLTNLKEIAGGNRETEKALFDAFMVVFAKAIANLEKSLKKNQTELWREQAHFLKGSSGNIGAQRLSALCRQAEKDYKAEKQEKASVLEAIKREFSSIKNLLASEAD